VQVRSSDDVELAVHDLGGDGPPLLVAHATGFHGRAWGPLAPALASRFRCWSLDFRGHGDSTRPVPPHFDWQGFGDDVLAVVDALGAGALFGLGHSQGATAFLLAEQARPGTFEALYLYEPVAPPPGRPASPDDDHPLVVGARRRHDTFTSVDAAVAHLAAKRPLANFDPAALRDFVEHGVVTLPGGGVTLKCRREDEAQVYRMGQVQRAFDHLDEVRCPTTVARGSHSEAMSAELTARQAAELPAGRLEVFDGLGHFGLLEEPSRVAGSVVRALLDG
jgi:pimeloyl-ACP methyl ester carboxylesterase